MQKTYRSTSAINVGVTFRGGGHKRIKFNPYSYGGSIYVTSNKEEMWALEHNGNYGGMFYLESVIEDDAQQSDAVSSTDRATETRGTKTTDQQSKTAGTDDDQQTETVGNNDQPTEMDGTKEVEVNDYDEAKDYLVENHGYTRTQLRSKVSINDAAEKCGVKFIGI